MRVRLLIIPVLLAALFVVPSVASAVPFDNSTGVYGGYPDNEYAPAGAHYEGQEFDLEAVLTNDADAYDPATGLELEIVWDDMHSVIDPSDITFSEADVECTNAPVAPSMGDEGYDKITCVMDPTFELEEGASGTFTVPVVPTKAPTTDWVDHDLEQFFQVRTSNVNGSPDANSGSVRTDITDIAVSDLAAMLTGPSAVTVPNAGVTATYAATITNAGPSATPSTWAYFLLPQQVKYVSGTAAGGAVDCVPADQSSENAERGLYLMGCPSGALAVGQSRAYSITVNLSPATGQVITKPLALPLTYKVEVTSGFELMDYAAAEDANPTNDFASVTTAATAPVRPVVVIPSCPAGTTGTPPNCVDAPKTFVGTKKSGTFVGGTAADTFTGGLGNETFKGGAGNDTANGGKGNDKLFGEAGNDKLFGGLGNDKLVGGPGSDTMNGGAGNDAIDAKDGKAGDTIVCGPGKDTVVADKKDKVAKDCEKVKRK